MNDKLYKTLTNDQKALHMATGRVTVSAHTLPVKDENGQWIGMDTKYVAKCRGIVISPDEKYRFDTREEALAAGKAAHKKFVEHAQKAGLL